MTDKYFSLQGDLGILAVGMVVGAAIAGVEVSKDGTPPHWDCADVDSAWTFVQTKKWPAFGGTDTQVLIVDELERGRWSYRQLRLACRNTGS